MTQSGSGSYPDYIDYPGQLVMQAPFQLNSTQIYAFVFQGDENKMQNTLDIRLNNPFSKSNLRYVPMGSNVLFTFSVTANGFSESAVNKEQGYILEEEIAFWMPVIEQKLHNGKWIANRFVFFIPFIFVNNPVALVAGREVYGFPKTIGSFAIPANKKYADAFTIDTMSFAKFAPNTPLITNRLLKVERSAVTRDAGFTEDWKDGKDAAQDLTKMLWDGTNRSLIGDWNLFTSLLKDLLTLQVPSVFLKQFRSAQNDGKAVYQALINSGFKVNGFSGGGLLKGDYTLSLNHLDSFPIGDALGLYDGQKVKDSFWVNVGFENIVGTELFVA